MRDEAIKIKTEKFHKMKALLIVMLLASVQPIQLSLQQDEPVDPDTALRELEEAMRLRSDAYDSLDSDCQDDAFHVLTVLDVDPAC